MGEGGVGGAGGGVERASDGESAVATAAAAAGGSDGAGSSHAVLAERPGCRLWCRRHLLAAVSVVTGAGMLHVTVKT